MTDIKTLELKIRVLEKRVEDIENKLNKEDPLYGDAKRLVIKHQKATVSFLQRYLLIDYDRAAGILDRLRAEGVVELPAGSKS
jgi:DNA segregation ATPase FtsK/SpoIIIE-like protein